MLENMGLGLIVGGGLALSVILMVAQWPRIRRGDLRMRSHWGFGFGELIVLSTGWIGIAALAWWGRGLDNSTFTYEAHSLSVILLSAFLAFASVLLPVLGRRKRQRLHSRGLST